MFGILLHDIKIYELIIHLGCLCFSIQAIQVYNVSKKLSNMGQAPKVIPFDDHEVIPGNSQNLIFYRRTHVDGTIGTKALIRKSAINRAGTIVGSAGRIDMVKKDRNSLALNLKEKSAGIRK